MNNPSSFMNRLWGLMLTILVILLTSGCQSEDVYREIKILENDIWNYDQSMTFESEISDTSETYELGLLIKHLKSYPFQNLYVRFIHGEHGEVMTDTITVDLVNKDGYFNGECNIESCLLEKTLLKGVRFENAGKQTFTLEQFTRNESLEGIREIGMFIRKVNPAQ